MQEGGHYVPPPSTVYEKKPIRIRVKGGGDQPEIFLGPIFEFLAYLETTWEKLKFWCSGILA